ncbi:hypothetical protein M427DRAFT_159128 [Gonapodya prolifera JEL478]|uniref:Uncharacterized protein n=1 Tax=Gonapodya prolifera (strain JEL478) TaxID=1344416 RepID=A0A139A182_GONPJ|nr:hypothetical protein M427DRAFT_159128 [Gonapodya prolifera JEL478]|eukprot:KXS10502.1 hypothetical protein M427DRAFT_159128 [Gonapodya prolifera JEL478]
MLALRPDPSGSTTASESSFIISGETNIMCEATAKTTDRYTCPKTFEGGSPLAPSTSLALDDFDEFLLEGAVHCPPASPVPSMTTYYTDDGLDALFGFNDSCAGGGPQRGTSLSSPRKGKSDRKHQPYEHALTQKNIDEAFKLAASKEALENLSLSGKKATYANEDSLHKAFVHPGERDFRGGSAIGTFRGINAFGVSPTVYGGGDRYRNPTTGILASAKPTLHTVPQHELSMHSPLCGNHSLARQQDASAETLVGDIAPKHSASLSTTTVTIDNTHMTLLSSNVSPISALPGVLPAQLNRKRSASLGSIGDLSSSFRLGEACPSGQSHAPTFDMFGGLGPYVNSGPCSSSLSPSFGRPLPASHSHPNLSSISSGPSNPPHDTMTDAGTNAKRRRDSGKPSNSSSRQESWFDINEFLVLDDMEDVTHAPLRHLPPGPIATTTTNPPSSPPLQCPAGGYTPLWIGSVGNADVFDVTVQEKALERALANVTAPPLLGVTASSGNVARGVGVGPMPSGQHAFIVPTLPFSRIVTPPLQATIPVPAKNKVSSTRQSNIPRTRSQPIAVSHLRSSGTVSTRGGRRLTGKDDTCATNARVPMEHSPGVNCSDASGLGWADVETWKREVAMRKEKLAEMKRVAEMEALEASALLRRWNKLQRT